MPRRRTLTVLLSLTLTWLTGCSTDADKSAPTKKGNVAKNGKDKIKVGFVSNNTGEFWTIAEAGSNKAAGELDVEVIFRRPNPGTAAEQKRTIEDVLTQEVKAIAISVNDPKNQRNFLNEIAAKVPLITQDNDAPDTKRLCYLGTDNYKAGKEVGKLVKEAMPQGGKIAIFVGQPDAQNAQERRQGVLDELAGTKNAKGPEKFGKHTLHHPPAYFDYVDAQKCKEQAADALTQLQDEDNVCLVGLWQYNPPAIYQAVKQAGKLGKVKIVGFDEHDTTLLAIKDGHIYATVVQNPFEFGYQSVKIMTALAKGDQSVLPKDGILHIEHRVIKRDNVEEFHKELRKLLKKE